MTKQNMDINRDFNFSRTTDQDRVLGSSPGMEDTMTLGDRPVLTEVSFPPGPTVVHSPKNT